MSTITATHAAPQPTPDAEILSEKVDINMRKGLPPSGKYTWEIGPMQLIPTPASATGQTDQYTHGATDMALVHNCIIRGMNSIYVQAPHIPLTEHANFVAYSLSIYQALCKHHDGEEETFFPSLEKATGETGLMESNVQGHRDFHDKLDEWGHWLESCAARKNNFAADMCQDMMDSFMAPLGAHLADEIPTLLALSRFGDKLNLTGLMEEEAKAVMGGMSKTTQLPAILLNHDITYENGLHNFPPIPPPVRFVLREVCGRKQKEWWKFSTCGFNGRPREVRFLEVKA